METKLIWEIENLKIILFNMIGDIQVANSFVLESCCENEVVDDLKKKKLLRLNSRKYRPKIRLVNWKVEWTNFHLTPRKMAKRWNV